MDLQNLENGKAAVHDASVFPNNVSGNIVSSVYSVAEKAADLIKEDWDFAPVREAMA